MRAARWIADSLTWLRAAIAVALAGLGLFWPAAPLGLVAALMLVDWSGDALDGFFARRGPPDAHSWIGAHDLQVDMLVAVGLLVYLAGAGWVNVWLAGGYLLVWAGVYWGSGRSRSLGMLFQAPVYGGLILLTLRSEPLAGGLILAWIAAMIVITWPRFPQEVVPGFLAGLAHGRASPPPPTPHVRTGRSSR